MARQLYDSSWTVTELELNAGSFAILDPAKNKDYGRDVIPSTRDTQISDLMRAVRDQNAFGEVADLSPRGASSVLNVFAERSASIAVRHQDVRELRAGLLAAAIAQSLAEDEREVIPALALLHRAAEMIGHDPNSEFSAINELSGGDTGRALVEFLRRSPVDKSVEAMGYEEGNDRDGFRFLRNW